MLPISLKSWLFTEKSFSKNYNAIQINEITLKNIENPITNQNDLLFFIEDYCRENFNDTNFFVNYKLEKDFINVYLRT